MEHLNNLGLLLISAMVEASTFKFGTQLVFGEYVTITTLVANLVGAGWPTGPHTPYHVPCTMQHKHKCDKTANINVNKKLSCRRGTARRFLSLIILLSHSRSLTVIRNDTVE